MIVIIVPILVSLVQIFIKELRKVIVLNQLSPIVYYLEILIFAINANPALNY